MKKHVVMSLSVLVVGLLGHAEVHALEFFRPQIARCEAIDAKEWYTSNGQHFYDRGWGNHAPDRRIAIRFGYYRDPDPTICDQTMRDGVDTVEVCYANVIEIWGVDRLDVQQHPDPLGSAPLAVGSAMHHGPGARRGSSASRKRSIAPRGPPRSSPSKALPGRGESLTPRPGRPLDRATR